MSEAKTKAANEALARSLEAFAKAAAEGRLTDGLKRSIALTIRAVVRDEIERAAE